MTKYEVIIAKEDPGHVPCASRFEEYQGERWVSTLVDDRQSGGDVGVIKPDKVRYFVQRCSVGKPRVLFKSFLDIAQCCGKVRLEEFGMPGEVLGKDSEGGDCA